jgi:predicted nucleic acid-binding protein
MSGSSLFIDTNIAIYLLAGDETLATMLNKCQVHLSFITELELPGYKHISLKERQKIKGFPSSCFVVDITKPIKEKSIRIRQQHKLKLPGCIIAASALHPELPFISADKDFAKVKPEPRVVREVIV